MEFIVTGAELRRKTAKQRGTLLSSCPVSRRFGRGDRGGRDPFATRGGRRCSQQNAPPGRRTPRRSSAASSCARGAGHRVRELRRRRRTRGPWRLVEELGFRRVGRRRSKDVDLYAQGDVACRQSRARGLRPRIRTPSRSFGLCAGAARQFDRHGARARLGAQCRSYVGKIGPGETTVPAAVGRGQPQCFVGPRPRMASRLRNAHLRRARCPRAPRLARVRRPFAPRPKGPRACLARSRASKMGPSAGVSVTSDNIAIEQEGSVQFIRPHAVLTAREFEAMGHPQELGDRHCDFALRRKPRRPVARRRAGDGTPRQYCPKCRCSKLSDLIGLAEFEALDASIVARLLHSSIFDPIEEAPHSP